MAQPRLEAEDQSMELTPLAERRASRQGLASWFAGISIAIVIFGLLTTDASFDMVSTVIAPFYAMVLAVFSLCWALVRKTSRWLPIVAIVLAAIGIANAIWVMVEFSRAMQHMGF